MRARSGVLIGAVLLVGLALRLPGLAWFPSPAGDEGNWASYGLEISRGQPAQLAPEGAFVSLLYAHLIAASIRVFGVTFVATRIVGVLGIVAGMVASYAVLAGLGARRAGLAVAAVLAVHPWAVVYSRTASVPYALALTVMTVGPLLFVAGVLRRRGWLVAAGTIVVSAGIHFSPLSAVAAVACAAFTVRRDHRWVWRHPAPYAAAALALAHAAPVIIGAGRVAQAAPDLRQTENFMAHAGMYVHMVGTGLMGEATVRHFTNAALAPWPAALLLVPLLAIVAAGVRAGRGGALGGFAALYFATGLLVAPLILAPGRNWYLPANHMDRYLFVVLPGFALLVGEAAEDVRRHGRILLAALLAWLLLGCTARMAWALWRGGVDHGEGVFDGGGGYRGWLVSDTPRATMFQVRDAALAEGGRGRGAILVADRTFIPLAFAMDGTGIRVHDVRREPIPPREDGLYYILLWPDHILSVGVPPSANPKYVESNRRLRDRMGRLFGRTRLVRLFRERDGSPLLEMWRAEEPAPRLRVEDTGPLDEG